jgi:tRNA threonylcarbamoyladenosine biosynthesis protein TsaB
MRAMKILGFDTSHGRCSVTISDDMNIISTADISPSSMQAEMLVPLVEEALLKASLQYQDIDYLAVTTGPGSFTGIRIGLATASGICLASNIIPVALSNFDVIHLRICEQSRNCDSVVVVINAYRSQVYVQTYIKGASASGIEMINVEHFMSYIENLRGNIAIGGSGLEYVMRDDLINDNIILLPRFPNADARTVCRLAQERIASCDINSNLEPLYVRFPDAKMPILLRR